MRNDLDMEKFHRLERRAQRLQQHVSDCYRTIQGLQLDLMPLEASIRSEMLEQLPYEQQGMSLADLLRTNPTAKHKHPISQELVRRAVLIEEDIARVRAEVEAVSAEYRPLCGLVGRLREFVNPALVMDGVNTGPRKVKA